MAQMVNLDSCVPKLIVSSAAGGCCPTRERSTVGHWRGARCEGRVSQESTRLNNLHGLSDLQIMCLGLSGGTLEAV